MLHKEIPFLRIGLPLCLGIFAGRYIYPENYHPGVIIAIILIGVLISMFSNKYFINPAFGVGLTFILFAAGIMLYSIEIESITNLKPEPLIFSCTVSDFPVEKEKSYMLKIKLNNKIRNDTIIPVTGSMILYHKKDTSLLSLLPGDLIIIKCTPHEITNMGNPGEFDYRFYMENHGIKYYAFTNSTDIKIHKTPRHRKISHRALIIREKIIGQYRSSGISDDNLAIVAAITLGQKNLLDPEQKQNFIKAGVVHIMAVSGLHAVILSMFVFNLLFFLKGKLNFVRIIICILILWTFALITGLTPSVVRASLMFSFIQAGYLMKRPVNSINSVLASAFVLIIIKPTTIFATGFLLSYSAVIYIIIFYKDLYSIFVFNSRLVDKIWQAAVVTIVAQAGTLPITISFFNRFPVFFIITNILIVPLSSLLIVLGFLIPVTYPLHVLSKLLACLLNYLTELTEFLTSKIASLPHSTLENIGMTPVECILLTFTIFSFSYFILKKRTISIIIPLSTALLYVLTVTALDISTSISNELIVYNTSGSTTIGIRTGKILNLYSDTPDLSNKVSVDCATRRLKIKKVLLEKDIYSLKVAGRKILITNSLNRKVLESYAPEIVILTNVRQDINRQINFPHPEAVILTRAASQSYYLQVKLNLEPADTLHLISKSGAYIRKL